MTLINGNCLDRLKTFSDNSIDAIVTDPPYGLSFMGKKWDYDVPSVEIWKECLRVLKPGGYLLAFAGTRTQHRMACNIEDAGFEIRDMIAWVYGSGFPKSLNIGKAVDKLQGGKRDVVGQDQSGSKRSCMAGDFTGGKYDLTKGTSEWEGYGTALKPALEPITVARKPLSEKTVAENCLKWGVGGIDIDGSRVGVTKEDFDGLYRTPSRGGIEGEFNACKVIQSKPSELGRFPANLIHDGSDEVVDLFPNSGNSNRGYTPPNNDKTDAKSKIYGFAKYENMHKSGAHHGDSGSAARFFYCAKASKKERNMGCEDMEDKNPCYESHRANYKNTKGIETPYAGTGRSGKNLKNNHPTIKPIALMKYLVNLVSREGHTVLDPFMGSGTTGIACKELGREFIGIEMSEEYIEIAKRRIGLKENDNEVDKNR